MTAPERPADAGHPDADPDSSSEGIDPAVAPDEDTDTVTTREESRVGPGAGDNPVVKVTAPVQHEDDAVTKHPTLRQDGEGSGDGYPDGNP